MVVDFIINLSSLTIVLIVISFLWSLFSLVKQIVKLIKSKIRKSDINVKSVAIPFLFLTAFIAISKVSTIVLLSEIEGYITNGADIELAQLPEISTDEFSQAYINRFYKKGLAGSHPSDEGIVDITHEGNKVKLIVRRDSRDSNLFWLSVSGYLLDSKVCFIRF